MNKKRWAGILILILSLSAVWAAGKQLFFSGGAGREMLTITALSIGKADALIIQESDQVILIDAGEQDDGDTVVQKLKDEGIKKIDLFIVTHFDKDHVGGAAYIMEEMEVAAVRMPDYEGDREEYREFLSGLGDHPDVIRLTEPRSETVGNMELTVYPAEDPEEIQNSREEYDNDMSLVTSIRYGERSFLFAGDIEQKRIRQMLAADTDWRHDWIKLPHHGKYEKALKDLLEEVAPATAVICCSRKNPAEEETRKLLEEQRIQVWDTEEQNVVTVCDGETVGIFYGTGQEGSR